MDDEVAVLTAASPKLKALERAADFARGERLVEWLSTQNEKAIAPSGPALARARTKAFASSGRAAGRQIASSDRKQRKREVEWVQAVLLMLLIAATAIATTITTALRLLRLISL